MKRASLLDTVKTVLAGAIGIRRRGAAEGARLNPVHLIVAAIVLAALFVLTLVMVVRTVTG